MNPSWQETYSEDNTDRIAEAVLAQITPSEKTATVLALQGDLGAGKTTLTKSIAKSLGVTETVISPTFVIAKFYNTLRQAQGKPSQFEHLAHIDAYRIESNDELKPLRWEEMVQQPKTLIVVEWPERIGEALPHDTYYFDITHEGDQRIIKKV